MFNTTTLGYKVRSGVFKKHSEQLNKYVAGLFDADGSFNLAYKLNSTGKYSVYMQASITLSGSTDPDASLLRALREHYKLGSIYHMIPTSELAKSSICCWHMNSKDSLKFINLICKHLLIKGTHAENLSDIVSELSGFTIGNDALEELKDYVRCSRKSSKWLKHPKHPSWAWLAGYIDGDGHYRCRLNRERKGTGTSCNELKLFVGASVDDSFILHFLQEHLGGSLRLRKDNLWFWQRALGSGSTVFSIKFLKKMRKFCCLETKYNVICRMLDFHLPAETK